MFYEDVPQMHHRVQVTYLKEKIANVALDTFLALGSIHVIYTFNPQEWKWSVNEAGTHFK